MNNALDCELFRLRKEVDELRKDKELLDFLASPSNRIANVQLPTECVERHPHDMRAAIRDAMGMNDDSIFNATYTIEND